jgi:hypothetical protein
MHRRQPETPDVWVRGANGRRVSRARFRVVGCGAFRLDFDGGLGGEAEETALFLPVMRQELRTWLTELRNDALEFVGTLKADDRQTVGMYRVPLALWQRQDNARQKAAIQTLVAASTRKVPDIEVDHILPWSIWNALTSGDSEQDLRDWGNSIGNCLLLTKTFNISKGTKTLDEWLAELQDLEGFDATHWKRMMRIPVIMARFDYGEGKAALQRLVKLIRARERVIKAGLREYVESSTQA